MQGAVNQQLYEFANRWQSAPHGGKGRVMDEASSFLGLSRATLHRTFKSMVATPVRKRRNDAGTTSLTRDEAVVIAAVVMEHMRKNGKRLKRFSSAVDECRLLGLIKAQRTDPATGEVINLSTSAIVAALRIYRMHPDQLLRPAPAVHLASLHPNHVWQIDASRCVLYYLPPAGSQDNGLRIQEHSTHYKNQPANQIKAIRQSIWRYNITDHRSGWIFTDYVAGGETAENVIHVFMEAMTRRDGEALHGVPSLLMLDRGSANTAASLKNLCAALQVRLHFNMPGQPRAKGQVEKSQDIVEREFESQLKTLPLEQVQNLEQIRALAARWRRFYNGTVVMRRHGMTRDSAWLHITSEQLVIAPSIELMKEVSVSAPESRVVSDYLTVSFLGREFDVSNVPGVLNGEKLMICRNVMAPDTAQAIGVDDEGREVFHVLPEVLRDDFGQVVGAPTIGESYASHAETPAQLAAKEVELLAMDASTMEDAAAKRRAKSTFLGGRYDPLALMDNTPVPDHLPRKGTEHAMAQQAARTVLPPLTHIQAAKALRGRFEHWGARHYEWMVGQYPDGVPADDLDSVEAAMRAAMTPRVLPLTRVA